MEGNLPLHILPQGFSFPATKESMQSDQLQARRFIMKQYPQALKKTNYRGETPLVAAIHVDYNILVKDIITEFPESLKETDQRGKFPIQYAIESGNTDAVKLILQEDPGNIDLIPLQEYPNGDDRQRTLAAIAEALPETFDIACNDDDDESLCQLSKNLVNQFFVESKLSNWGQDVIWRLMKSSYNRKQRERRDKEEFEMELRSLRAENKKLERKSKDISEALETTINELTESKASLKAAMDQSEQSKHQAKEEKAKYLDVSKKIKSLLKTRKFNGEKKVGFAQIGETSKYSVAELKAILESLIERLESTTTTDMNPSMTYIAATYLVKDTNNGENGESSNRNHFINTIEALQREIQEL
eukprot:CAMPEP_0178903838 /NCGR_PEP_ID=MMETSP0786-20121207/5371_1 /TAXON_ID=186022 /ORGANISM="Thalassionema frauenfeldii, Strain CCMP 1798" /LENGTH=358 /DNA_ID=CAMNT_0020575237 /DNA_START=287 /DNA_END=1363 /DNA_ORIENTATION=+